MAKTAERNTSTYAYSAHPISNATVDVPVISLKKENGSGLLNALNTHLPRSKRHDGRFTQSSLPSTMELRELFPGLEFLWATGELMHGLVFVFQMRMHLEMQAKGISVTGSR